VNVFSPIHSGQTGNHSGWQLITKLQSYIACSPITKGQDTAGYGRIGYADVAIKTWEKSAIRIGVDVLKSF
jgi:hypothetical protein